MVLAETTGNCGSAATQRASGIACDCGKKDFATAQGEMILTSD
jgi:hypothetical protein